MQISIHNINILLNKLFKFNFQSLLFSFFLNNKKLSCKFFYTFCQNGKKIDLEMFKVFCSLSKKIRCSQILSKRGKNHLNIFLTLAQLKKKISPTVKFFYIFCQNGEKINLEMFKVFCSLSKKIRCSQILSKRGKNRLNIFLTLAQLKKNISPTIKCSH